MQHLKHPTEPAHANAVGHAATEPPAQIWFTRWFLDDCYCEAPGVIWERDGNIITRTYKDDYVRPSGLPNPPPAKWILTAYTALDGCRLAVWPD